MSDYPKGPSGVSRVTWEDTVDLLRLTVKDECNADDVCLLGKESAHILAALDAYVPPIGRDCPAEWLRAELGRGTGNVIVSETRGRELLAMIDATGEGPIREEFNDGDDTYYVTEDCGYVRVGAVTEEGGDANWLSFVLHYADIDRLVAILNRFNARERARKAAGK